MLIVRTDEKEDPMQALNRGYYVTTVLAIAGFAVAVHYLLRDNWWFLASGVVGILAAFLFVYITSTTPNTVSAPWPRSPKPP